MHSDARDIDRPAEQAAAADPLPGSPRPSSALGCLVLVARQHGVHLTLDMAGGARFGPNVQWLASNDPAAIDYTVSPAVPEEFAPRIAAYWPAITAEMLAPGYSGVRPKIGGPKDANADFRIEGPDVHGLVGLVNLFAIESPGLTSSLAIAERVETLLRD